MSCRYSIQTSSKVCHHVVINSSNYFLEQFSWFHCVVISRGVRGAETWRNLGVSSYSPNGTLFVKRH